MRPQLALAASGVYPEPGAAYQLRAIIVGIEGTLGLVTRDLPGESTFQLRAISVCPGSQLPALLDLAELY
jgi:hypothetical protein